MTQAHIFFGFFRRSVLSILILVGLLIIGLISYQTVQAQYQHSTPTIFIANVDVGNTVTIMTNNFPANQNFTLSMGPYGSYGIGHVVTRFNSGAGGQQFFSFNIPADLKGQNRIAIRTQSDHAVHPYFSYNWFWNVAQAVPDVQTPSTTVVTGNPRIVVKSVVQNQSVTISGSGFPANQEFVVTMGSYGTAGLNGVVVERFNSGAGGGLERTVAIPSQLAGHQRIAIRMATDHPYPFYAFNWFWNNSTQ